MTRIFTAGAESGDTLFWDILVNTISTVTSPARIGGRAFSIFGNISAASVQKNFTGVTELYLRFAYYFLTTTPPNEFQWRNSTTVLGSIRYNATSQCLDIYTSTGTLQVSGTKILNINTWYVIELHVKIHDSTGVIEFKVDGVLQPSFAGDTKPGAATTVDNLIFQKTGATSTTIYLDDLALNDTAGGADNSWCGDGHLYALTPNADGDSSQLLGSDGNSVNNYLLVDEIPSNSDTDYVESATATQKDLYGLTDLPALPSGSTVSRVLVESRAREIVASGDSIYLGVKQGSTEGWSSAIPVGASYARQTGEFLVNPATGIAWTESEINSMQAGVKIA